MGYLKTDRQVHKRSNNIVGKAFKIKKAKSFDDKFYSVLTKKVGNKTVGEILKQNETNGCCYFYSLLLASCNPKLKLVYGYLRALDKVDYFFEPFGHAWVESDDFVYDTSCKAVIEKDYYYKMFQAEECQEYSNLSEKQIATLAIEAVESRPRLIPILKNMKEFKSATLELVKNVTDDFLNEKAAKKIVDIKIEQKEKSK